MSGIFKSLAPLYWNVGLPVIPLLKDQKRPAIDSWSVYGERMPTKDEMNAWVERCGDGNIGLPLGPCSGLVAVDIDSEDPRVLEILNRLLPYSPWIRRGKKGEVRMYRYSGERLTRISSDEGMVCEILSKGSQVVLPGSIHPDTKQPYTATGDLWKMKTILPALIPGIDEIIRQELKDAGIKVGEKSSIKVTSFVPAGARNNSMTAHAGLLARAVTRGERTLLEALGEMEEWVKSYVEKVIGDTMSVEEAKSKVIYFLVRDVHGAVKRPVPAGWDEGLTEEDKLKLGLRVSAEDEKWTEAQIVEWMGEMFVNNPQAGSVGQSEGINEALHHVVRSEGQIDVLAEERILRFLSIQSGGTVSLGALRKKLKELRGSSELSGESHSEIAKAAAEWLSEYGEVRHEAGKFWQWKGSHWEVLTEGDVLKIVGNEFGALPACRKTSDYKQVVAFMRELTTKDLCLTQRRGVNFANGYLNENLELQAHHPDHGATYVLPYRYVPQLADPKKFPRFQKFMNESWGHDVDFHEKMDVFQEIVGVTMFNSATRYQKAFCFYGAAGSGKSVASQIIRGMLPAGSTSSIPPEKWNDQFLPAEMFGKVLNFAGELSDHKRIPGESFKQIVEGEVITARTLYQKPFEFAPSCAQLFLTNHLPKTSDTSAGFNRRWLFLEWNRAVPENRRIPELAKLISLAEREAIAAWAVLGFKRLKENDAYTTPTSHGDLEGQMANDNNSVRYFLSSSPLLVVGKDQTNAVTSAHDLYQQYWTFCLAVGVPRREPINRFQKMMHELQGPFQFRILNQRLQIGVQEMVFEGIEVLPK